MSNFDKVVNLVNYYKFHFPPIEGRWESLRDILPYSHEDAFKKSYIGDWTSKEIPTATIKFPYKTALRKHK